MPRPRRLISTQERGPSVLQVILGGVAGLMVIGKLYWARLKSLLGFSTDDSSFEENETD